MNTWIYVYNVIFILIHALKLTCTQHTIIRKRSNNDKWHFLGYERKKNVQRIVPNRKKRMHQIPLLKRQQAKRTKKKMNSISVVKQSYFFKYCEAWISTFNMPKTTTMAKMQRLLMSKSCYYPLLSFHFLAYSFFGSCLRVVYCEQDIRIPVCHASMFVSVNSFLFPSTLYFDYRPAKSTCTSHSFFLHLYTWLVNI